LLYSLYWLQMYGTKLKCVNKKKKPMAKVVVILKNSKNGLTQIIYIPC
jgi:hypothetical protein